MVNSPDGATSSSVLGPFHILGSPPLPVGGDLIRDNAGPQVVVQGCVKDLRGKPITGANIEIWQTADNGLYSNQDSAQSDFNLRASMTSDDNGRYAFTTVRPAPYMVPTDGPVGELLRATGRDAWRPSHLHFIIQADGFRSLVTEVFPDDDPYLDSDAVLGVREDLVTTYEPGEDASALADDLQSRDNLAEDFTTLDFDFVLADK